MTPRFILPQIIAFFCCLLSAVPLSARTVTLTFETSGVDGASLSETFPDQSWAGRGSRESRVFGEQQHTASRSEGILFRFDLSRIPKDQRIVRAELLLPYSGSQPNSRIHLWRILQPWGEGVNHRYRSLRPKAEEWNEGGARGRGSDRASEPTASMTMTPATGEIALNVIGDVELWHTGSSQNLGWLLTTETAGEAAYFHHLLLNPRLWRLRITYEP